jgi:uncharacterized protein (TIGR02996 family)
MTKQDWWAAIKEKPYDTATRRAYADWLSENGFDDEAALALKWSETTMAEAVYWMIEFTDMLVTREGSAYPLKWEEVVEGAKRYVDEDVRFSFGGTLGMGIEALFDGWDEPEEDPKKTLIDFWAHWGVITGRLFVVEGGAKGENFFRYCCW